jgi:phosphoglycolate phosphatase-like HAD superfamily hydrolase
MIDVLSQTPLTGPEMLSVKFSPGFSVRPQISHVVFDFDGTLSWLRHGWPGIMLELFLEYVSSKPAESREALRQLLLNDILSLNGKSSIFQMRRCAERVRERGGRTPDPEILLAEYQRRLDLAIKERTVKILSGHAAADEFVIHGARSLLIELERRGLRLIILSGTIENRVKMEAELLGLTPFFGRHIYGGTANLAQSSKQAVIARLLDEEKITGEHLLAFGDGPVEIQLTKEIGGVAIAVASDEEENGSGRIHPQKSEQLAAAGADAVIADYRNAGALLEAILGPGQQRLVKP